MENVLNIKKKKNLNFILPSVYQFNGKTYTNCKGIIVIHLHYMERVSFCFHYIQNIPSLFDVYITSSDDGIIERLTNMSTESKRKYFVVQKENRGRDISSFLVAMREKILEYDFVCFTHDKKEKTEETKEDTDDFVYNIWENMLSSGEYILNILKTFYDNPGLGVLLPPEILSRNMPIAYRNTWDLNFDILRKLADELHLNCDLDVKRKPISVGTAFWARTAALKPLFEKKWSYEDFPREPLEGDGTISHAIERCFAYVAQSEGYETGIVMCDHYAGRRMDLLQDVGSRLYEMSREILDTDDLKCILQYEKVQKRIKEFTTGIKIIYIYGTGKLANRCYCFLRAMDILPNAFVVTNKEEGQEVFHNMPVKEITDIEFNCSDAGIILGAGQRNSLSMREEIKRIHPEFKNILSFGDLLMQEKEQKWYR